MMKRASGIGTSLKEMELMERISIDGAPERVALHIHQLHIVREKGWWSQLRLSAGNREIKMTTSTL
jgi:hypothetical protein